MVEVLGWTRDEQQIKLRRAANDSKIAGVGGKSHVEGCLA
jgi:hypothetical protein